MSDSSNTATSVLLDEALRLSRGDPESDECWDLICELRKRGDVETFETAASWCESQDASERVLAANLLSQLGYPQKKQEGGKTIYPFADQTGPLLDRLLNDPDLDVVDAAISASGHLQLYDLITKRSSLVAHPSSDLRYKVVRALCGAQTGTAIEFLIKLSSDQDDDIRDWATFGLGRLWDVDTPEVREVLFGRLTDEHFDTRSEALMGLALRHDSRVIPFIKAELEAETVSSLQVEAAGEIASADFVEPLEELLDWWDVDTELLHAALKRCKGEPDPENERRWETAPNRSR